MHQACLQRRFGDAGCPSASDAFRRGQRRHCRPHDCPRASTRRQTSDHPRGARPPRRTHLPAANTGIRLSGGGRARVCPWRRAGDARLDARSRTGAAAPRRYAMEHPHRCVIARRVFASACRAVLPSLERGEGRSAYRRIPGDAFCRSAIRRAAAGHHADSGGLRCGRPVARQHLGAARRMDGPR
jgi:hypothetical protein